LWGKNKDNGAKVAMHFKSAMQLLEHPNGNYLIEIHTLQGKIVKQVFVGKI